MNTLEQDIQKVRQLAHNQSCVVFWFEEGGGEVFHIWNIYILFSHPQYGGGEGSYEGTFLADQIEEMVRIAHTWT